MALRIPKKLLNEYGYNKKVAAGKWFDIEGIRLRLGFVKESRYFKTHIDDVTEKTKQTKDETKQENGERALHIWTKFLCSSIISDWDLVDDGTGKKAELSPAKLYELLEGYPHLVEKILAICSDNKQFLKDCSEKK